MLLLLVLTAAYVLAVANGIVTIDVARDLFWAIGRRRARLPAARSAGGIDRAAGGVVVLPRALAIWLVAVTGYFALLGLLAGSKYLLIYALAFASVTRDLPHCCRRCRSAGIAGYQLFGVGHPIA